MTTTIALQADAREQTGKGPARRLRTSGQVPGIVYGGSDAPAQIAVEERALVKELHKPGFFTRLIDLKVGKDTQRVIARDVQFHPVTDRPEHADFQRVSKDTKIHVHVPVHFHGQEKSPGIKRGGVLNIVRHDVELICTPEAIPQFLDLDISSANIGDSFHISHVKLPEGVTLVITDRDFTIATVAGRTKEEEVDTAAAAATAEAAAATAAGAPGAAAAAGDKKASGGDAKKPEAAAGKKDDKK